MDLVSVARIIEHIRVPLYRNAYALTLGSALTSVLGMVYWLLATRYYSADVVGVNSAAIAALLFLSAVSGLYLDGALVRFIPRAARATGRMVVYAYLAGASMSAIVSAAFLLGIDIWSPALGFLAGSGWPIVGFLLASVTSCVFVLEDAVMTGLRGAVWVPLENTIYALAKIALLLVFAKFLPEYGIVASWVLPVVVLIVPVNYFIFRHLIPRHRRTTEDIAQPVEPRQVATYVAGNYLGYLCMSAYLRLLPVLVIQQTDSRTSAYFYLPWVIASSLQLVSINMNQSLVVEGSLDQGRVAILGRRALVQVMRLLLPIVALLVVGAPYILRIFGSAYAREGADLLRLLALAVIPNTLSSLYFGVSRVRQRLGRVVLGQGAIAALTLGLSYVLVRNYGIVGVGIAVLASHSLVAMALLLTQLGPRLRQARHERGHRKQGPAEE
jgi:O-antigen/teichoic acid export membrane protein